MDVVTYLSEQLNESVEMKPFKHLKKLPLFLTSEYKYFECRIHDLDCVLVEAEDIKFSIDKITKHLSKLKDSGVERPVMVFAALDSRKRRKLVMNRVPFIVPGNQLYLPFIYINFTDKVTKVPSKPDRFTAATQMIFIMMLVIDQKEIVTKSIAENLGLTVMTVNRVLRQFIAMGIVVESGLGTKKKYFRISKKNFWEVGKNYMISPISKVMYLKNLDDVINVIYSSDSALAALTMMNYNKHTNCALDKHQFDQINPAVIIKESEVDYDLEYVRLERWKYNPNLFSKEGNVDIFSLYAIYSEINDPRIEIELEELIGEVLCED